MQYFISFLEGIITFISPCLLPMLPIYISYFAGGGERSTKKTVVNALGFVLGFIGGLIPALAGLTSVLASLYSLAALIPGIAIVVRRLHDVNKSGWYYFIALIPFVGFILLLIALCTDSVNENNNYNA